MIRIPKKMSFRICVYPSDQVRKGLIAHSLDLDIMGTGNSIQEALDELLELIEHHIQVCQEHDAQFEFPAPEEVWEKYEIARKKNRRVPMELLERVINTANKRLGHTAPLFDKVLASEGLPEEYLVTAS